MDLLIPSLIAAGITAATVLGLRRASLQPKLSEAKIRPVEGRRPPDPYRGDDRHVIEVVARMTRGDLPVVTLARLADAARGAGLPVRAARRRLEIDGADGKLALRLRVRHPARVTAATLDVQFRDYMVAIDLLFAIQPLVGPMEVSLVPAVLLFDALATREELHAANEEALQETVARIKHLLGRTDPDLRPFGANPTDP